MPIGKPILRVAKMKRSGRTCPNAVDAHLSRTRPTENADPERLKLNEWLVGSPGKIAENIENVLARARVDKTTLRKDSTIANDILLSVSPEWFRPENPDALGSWEKSKLDAFRSEAVALLKQEFGGRLVAAVLHLDEATPHIQAIVVPVVKRLDGSLKLSGKEYFGPDRLTHLQDAWQKRLERHGVGPREVGSTAKHTRIKTYYSAVQQAPDVPQAQPPAPPPLRALLPGGGDMLAKWQKAEAGKVAKRQKPLAAAAAKGMLYEAERQSADTMRDQIQAQNRRFAGLRKELDRTSEKLELTKDQVAILRGVPINEVAAVLEFTGEVGKRENAIDLVKRIGGLSFEEATRWMAIAFGPAAAGAAVRHHAATVPLPAAVLTSADAVKAAAVRKQLDALGSPDYRVTVMHKRNDGTRYAVNLCKTEAGEQLWNRDQIVSQIPRLTAENARGGNVFITPIDASTHHILIDDLTDEGLATFKTKGYAPSVVTETSPGNHQAVVKVSKNLPEAAINEWFKSSNRELGDAKITGLVHPMRLAGFQNRKAKYEQENGHFPFVRVVEATRIFCAHAKAVITEIVRQMATEPPRYG